MKKQTKFKRYDEGGSIGEESNEDTTSGMAEAANAEPTTVEAPAKKQTFGQAFASARKGGAKTFEFNGKKYTTELASSKPAAIKPKAESSSASTRPQWETDLESNIDRMSAARRAVAAPKSPTLSNADKARRMITPSVNLKAGGSVSSASKRADGIATKGKTRGTMVMCGGGMTKRK